MFMILQAQAQIQAQELAQRAQAQSKAEGKAAAAEKQPRTKTAESADVKSSEDDDSSQLHRKVVQSGDSELEPINLPRVHRHQALTQTTSAPYHNRIRDTLSESEEPREYPYDYVHSPPPSSTPPATTFKLKT